MEVGTLNKLVTSKEDILEVSKNLILEKGISSFNMREVASLCNISVGAVYNYFPSKAELIMATVESVWIEIFEPFNENRHFDSFADAVSFMFDIIQNGNSKYPGFFTFHSLNFASSEKKNGIQLMKKYFSFLQERLALVLDADKNVRSGVFDDCFTKQVFIQYIFTLLLSDLLKGNSSCSLLGFIRNCIY